MKVRMMKERMKEVRRKEVKGQKNRINRIVKRRLRGQITVYASITIVLVISLVTACIQSATVSYLKSNLDAASRLSMEAVFAGYFRPILDEYDIFILKDTNQLQPILEEYIEKNIKDDEGATYTQVSFNITQKMMDNGGQAFYDQVQNYMEYAVYTEAIGNITNIAAKTEQIEAINLVSQKIYDCSEKILEVEKKESEVVEYLNRIEMGSQLSEAKQLSENVESISVADCINVVNDLDNKTTQAMQSLSEYIVEKEAAMQNISQSMQELENYQQAIGSEVYASYREELVQLKADEEQKNSAEGGIYDLEEKLLHNKLVLSRANQMLSTENSTGQTQEEYDQSVISSCTDILEELHADGWDGIKSTDKANEEKANISIITGLIQTVTQGISGLVLNGKNLSEKTIQVSELASSLNTDGKLSDSTVEENAKYSIYVGSKFANFCSYQSEDSDTSGKQLDYVTEYILCGKVSDKQNIEDTIGRITALRSGVNLAYLMTDTQKKQEAFALATSLLGITGNAGLIKSAQLLILTAWAYAESISDVRCLYDGKKIEWIKTRNSWQLTLQNLLDFDLSSSNPESEKGIDYNSFLEILLFLQSNEKITRTMDAMELRMIESGYTDFRMIRYCSGANATIVFRLEESNQEYTREVTYSY